MNDRYSFDPYAVLGLERDATDADVKARYRELIQKWHPDVSVHPDANEMTAEINGAYAILGDAKLRAEYDGGPAAFMDEFGGWFAEWLRVWAITECLRCGKPLYNQYAEHTSRDGTVYRLVIPRRRDATYCSNACRQAAYRARKKAAAAAARAARQVESRGPKSLEP